MHCTVPMLLIIRDPRKIAIVIDPIFVFFLLVTVLEPTTYKLQQ